MNARRAALQARYRCTRCRRVQLVADVCGLCCCTLFEPCALDVAPPPLRPLRTVAPVSSPPAFSVAEFLADDDEKDEGFSEGPHIGASSCAYNDSDGLPPAPTVEIASERQIRVALPEDVAKATRAERVSLGATAREVIERAPCSYGDVDRVLGGGLPLSQVILLGGRRGTGKSRLMLALAAMVAKATGRSALYCSTEGQRPGELANMVPLELDPTPIEVCCSRKLSDVVSHARELDCVLVVVDSVQELELDGVRSESDEHARQCMALFDELARVSRACVVCVSQMSGFGRMRGSEKYQQLCDTIAGLTRVDEAGMESDDGERIRLAMRGKNRGGPTNYSAHFRFDRDGVLRPEEREPSMSMNW